MKTITSETTVAVSQFNMSEIDGRTFEDMRPEFETRRATFYAANLEMYPQPSAGTAYFRLNESGRYERQAFKADSSD